MPGPQKTHSRVNRADISLCQGWHPHDFLFLCHLRADIIEDPLTPHPPITGCPPSAHWKAGPRPSLTPPDGEVPLPLIRNNLIAVRHVLCSPSQDSYNLLHMTQAFVNEPITIWTAALSGPNQFHSLYLAIKEVKRALKLPVNLHMFALSVLTQHLSTWVR